MDPEGTYLSKGLQSFRVTSVHSHPSHPIFTCFTWQWLEADGPVPASFLFSSWLCYSVYVWHSPPPYPKGIKISSFSWWCCKRHEEAELPLLFIKSAMFSIWIPWWIYPARFQVLLNSEVLKDFVALLMGQGVMELSVFNSCQNNE